MLSYTWSDAPLFAKTRCIAPPPPPPPPTDADVYDPSRRHTHEHSRASSAPGVRRLGHRFKATGQGDHATPASANQDRAGGRTAHRPRFAPATATEYTFFAANLGGSACISEILTNASENNQQTNRYTKFGNSAGNCGGSAFQRPFGHDLAGGLSKLVALLPNSM